MIFVRKRVFLEEQNMNSYKIICVLALLFCLSQISNGAAPSNDDRQNAKSVGNVTDQAFDTTEATYDGPEEQLCTWSKNIWYCYTATCTGTATISLCGSSFDTRLGVYSSCSSTPDLDNLIECSDDICGDQSEAVIPVTAGNKYLIEVGGLNMQRYGVGLLNITCDSSPPYTPSNDNWYSAHSVGNVLNLEFDTTDATRDGNGDCVRTPNIWYCYTATHTTDVTVSLCGSEFDTKLAVYDGCDIFPRFENSIDCNDDFCDRQSQITFAATAGKEYLIEVGGYEESGPGVGQGVLTIYSDLEPPVKTDNDDCQDAKLIGNVTGLAFDTSEATFDGPGRCLTSPNIWYIYTATCTGEATVSLCGSGYDTKMAVYNGGGCNPSQSRLIECNDDSCGWQSEVTFDATAGQQYLIEVGGFGDNTGQGLISVSCEGSAPTSQSDLGDAPDSTNNFGRNMTAYPKGGPSGIKAHYPTVYNDGRATGPFGPIHLNAQTVVAHLGKQITSENEADTGPDQDITNNIKPTSNMPDNDKGDDGMIFPINMPKCSWTTLDYIVNVVNPGTNLWVNVWCDWNRDGDWDDSTNTNPSLSCSGGIVSEWAVQNQYLINLPAGLSQITTPAFLSWHPNTGTMQIWMRITLSDKPWTVGSAPGSRGNGGSGPQNGHVFGETEDYYFIPETSFSICQDYNGDGVINLDDLSAITTDWLDNSP